MADGTPNPSHDVDDDSIPDSAIVWRRIPKWHIIVDNNRTGEDRDKLRPSSAAFENDDNGSPMSAYLADELTDPQIILQGHEGYAVWWLTVQLLRRVCGQKIVRDPVDGLGGHAHLLVVGDKKQSLRSKLAKADLSTPPLAGWAVKPPESPSAYKQIGQ